VSVANRRGRKPKSQDQKLRDALERCQPAAHILERRKLFSGIVQPPPKDRLEGRSGEIDSEVCDAIGQLCALGYLDGHGHDAIEMRDKGRFWGGHYAQLMKPMAMKVGSAEPRSRSTGGGGALTGADLLFDRMDAYLPDYERQVLLTLIVDPLIGTYPDGEFPHWAKALIDEGLRQRGRFVSCGAFPNAGDYGTLAAAVRGLVVLVDGALPARWQNAA
jgi:hypothetical protein